MLAISTILSDLALADMPSSLRNRLRAASIKVDDKGAAFL
jgi:hypothetical protein